MKSAYDYKSIEEKWSKRWVDESTYTAPTTPKGEKRYILDMFPYPSGEGLHVGHVEGYTATDVVARFLRAQGFEVLHPIGWDAFGLPAENYAIKQGLHPRLTTEKNIVTFKRQIQTMGFSYSWPNELSSADPAYYRWTQWIFVQLHKAGLAYQKDAAVNWCEKDQTVLANEQVVDGKCERCGNEVVQKNMRQWFFKITDYADELLSGLDDLDWPESIKASQRNWIGKSEGSRLTFTIDGSDQEVAVFTTRPDTLMGCTYLVLAPEHQLVHTITTPDQRDEVAAYVATAEGKSELERTFLEKEKTGVFTGAFAVHPISGEKVPIWIADYVITGYGTGAIMAVPAHDERDLAFAQKYALPIKQVIAPLYVAVNHDAPRTDKETVRRRTVKVIVKHWSNDSIYCLDWTKQGWHTFVIGGIEDGETPEEAAVREVKEETGYQNIRTVRLLPVQTHSNFFASHKDINRYGDEFAVYIELGGEEYVEPDPAEVSNHVGRWLPRDEAQKYVDTPFSDLMWQAIDHPVVYTDHGVLINSGTYDDLSSADAMATITAAAGGTRETMWRLRDWLISRQRYWGAPIPIIHCDTCGAVPVPEKDLPVVLPDDVDFRPHGHSPLADVASFVNTVCPTCGKAAKRETDTMDTFVCSSWYYLRYPSVTHTDVPFAPEETAAWLPVDTYVGGAEHAVLHLLYARFFTKFLRDQKMLAFDEPFTRLRNVGIILGPDHAKMSKSKGNVINPDDVIREVGVDALRLHELFMGPFTDEKPWNTEAIVGVRRFLDQVWRISERISDSAPQFDQVALHTAIKKVTEDTADLRFNTAIAALMTLANGMQSATPDTASFTTLLRLLAPYAPHLVAELFEQKGYSPSPDEGWPVFDQKLLVAQQVTVSVQINGKLRGTCDVPLDTADETLVATAQAVPNVARHLAGATIKTKIVVKNRLVNFVVTD